MKLIMAIVKPFKLDEVREALGAAGVEGTDDFGSERLRPSEGPDRDLPRRRVRGELRAQGPSWTVVVDDGGVAKTVEAIKTAAATGKIGDGKIFVLNVEDALRIRTGETGSAAL